MKGTLSCAPTLTCQQSSKNGHGIFQQDNAPCYIVQVIQEWFQEYENYTLSSWSLNSPDFIPIEHFVKMLDQ